MEINYSLIKILIAAILFGIMFFVKKKTRWILALIITAYLVMMGANII